MWTPRSNCYHNLEGWNACDKGTCYCAQEARVTWRMRTATVVITVVLACLVIWDLIK